MVCGCETRFITEKNEVMFNMFIEETFGEGAGTSN
jgi:hypothetical protein